MQFFKTNKNYFVQNWFPIGLFPFPDDSCDTSVEMRIGFRIWQVIWNPIQINICQSSTGEII